jgi:hypothetical protein
LPADRTSFQTKLRHWSADGGNIESTQYVCRRRSSTDPRMPFGRTALNRPSRMPLFDFADAGEVIKLDIRNAEFADVEEFQSCFRFRPQPAIDIEYDRLLGINYVVATKSRPIEVSEASIAHLGE